AAFQHELGNSWLQNPEGIRAHNIEEAIAAYKKTLEVRTRETTPAEWAASMKCLGAAYCDRIHGDREKNLEKAITYCKHSLEVNTRESMPFEWATTMMYLGLTYFCRICGDRAQNLEESIATYGQALQIVTREAMPIQWAHCMMNLGAAYCDRIHGDREQNLEEAITYCKHSLEVNTRESMPIEWATSMLNLANAYLDRIQGNREQNIKEAIAACQQSLKVFSYETRPIEWAKSIMNLGTAYLQCVTFGFEDGDREQNLENAITAYKQALRGITYEAMPTEWATVMTRLSTVYFLRSQGDRAQNLKEAIAACQQALKVYTYETTPVEWAGVMNDLAAIYLKHPQGDRAQNLEEVISACQQALKVYTYETMSSQWAGTMNNLAIAYRNRIQGDRAQNIEEAIRIHEQASQLRIRIANPSLWANSMNNLANAYLLRIQGDRAQNIEEAITACKNSLEVSSKEGTLFEWANSMMNLANAYSYRMRGDRAQNIEEAITAYEQSLEVRTREAMPFEWAETMLNLANTYFFRMRGDRAQNLERGITIYEQVLQVTTREAMPFIWAQAMMNLANGYSERIRGNRIQNIEDAIHNYSQALEIFTPEAHPNDCRRTAYLLGNLCADNHRHIDAQANYQTALTAAEILYQSALFKSSQEAELEETNDLYRRAAYVYAKVGDLKTAVITIERGRARSLSQTLQRDRADLEAVRQINPDLIERYQAAAKAIQLLESTERQNTLDDNVNTLAVPTSEWLLKLDDQAHLSLKELRDQFTQSHQALQDCLTEIRQISGYESFLTLPTFDDISNSLQPNQPVIYLVPTPNGSLALVLNRFTHEPEHEIGDKTQTDITSIWLDDFTELDLQTLLTNPGNNGWLEAYQHQGLDRATWFNTLNRTLQSLWPPILIPILRHLNQAKCSSTTLIPTGLFSLLPLHAAWTRDTNGSRRYAYDFIQFTYAPNTLSLNAARTIAAHTPATKLLAINDPQPISSSSLPSSSIETANAVSAFPGKGNFKILQHEAATPEAVLDALPNYSTVHFSCHGSANFQTPLESGLLMANDEVLSLRDLLDLKLKGLRLAILSACETGIPGTELPDEVISLPTGLLQAGAAGVISSLWSVSDLSTMLLLSRFYDLWRPKNPDTTSLDPPEALRQAQLWLRDGTGPELAPYLQTSHPELAAKLEQAKDKRPFAHPFHWAAFTYTGV
ncbi:MAG: CHAT domain-containing protein, partial [Cyanobacteria bacterium P01_A01_bin.17]